MTIEGAKKLCTLNNKIISIIFLMMNIELGNLIQSLIELRKLSGLYYGITYALLLTFILFYYLFASKFNRFSNVVTTSIIFLGLILFVSNKFSKNDTLNLSDVLVFMKKEAPVEKRGNGEELNDEDFFLCEDLEKVAPLDETHEGDPKKGEEDKDFVITPFLNYGFYSMEKLIDGGDYIQEFKSKKDSAKVIQIKSPLSMEDYLLKFIGEKLFDKEKRVQFVKTFSLLFMITFITFYLFSLYFESGKLLVFVTLPIIGFKVFIYVFNSQFKDIRMIILLLSILVIGFLSIKLVSLRYLYALILSSLISSIMLVFVLLLLLNYKVFLIDRFTPYLVYFYGQHNSTDLFEGEKKNISLFGLIFLLTAGFSILMNLFIMIPNRKSSKKKSSSLSKAGLESLNNEEIKGSKLYLAMNS